MTQVYGSEMLARMLRAGLSRLGAAPVAPVDQAVPADWVRLFLAKLPDMRAPTIELEDDRDLCFDWSGLDGHAMLSASVSPTGRVVWATIAAPAGYRYGRFQLPAWPDEFARILEAVK